MCRSLDILDHHSLPLDSDQIVFAELPQRAADVRDAQAERIADQFLGQRHLLGAVVCRPIACSLVNSSRKKCATRSSADRRPLTSRQQSFRLLPEAKHELICVLSPRQRCRLACPRLHRVNIVRPCGRIAH